MSILTKQDIRDVMAINEATQGRGSIAALQHEILAAGEAHLSSPSSLFIIRSHEHWTHDFDRGAQHGLPDGFISRYLDELHEDDPLAPHIRENPAWRFGVLTNDRLVPENLWTGSRFFRELLEPCGIRHMLGVELVADGRQIGLIGFFRAGDAAPFSNRDIHKAALCSSAMSNSLQCALLVEDAFRRDERLATVISQITGVGFAVLDERLRLLFSTQEARHFMAELGTANDARELPAPLLRQAAALRRRSATIGTARHEKLEIGERLQCHRDGTVVDVRLRCAHVAPGETRYVIALKDALQRPCHDAQLLDLGLTRREAEIVQLVVSGLKNAEIAASLHLSINTVQTHLRSVFEKLHVRNRTSLLARVLGQPAVPGSRSSGNASH